jgi:hypothetical protein
MEGARNAAPRLAGRAIAGPHDYAQISGVGRAQQTPRRPQILDLHPQRRGDARKRVGDRGDQRPVAQTAHGLGRNAIDEPAPLGAVEHRRRSGPRAETRGEDRQAAGFIGTTRPVISQSNSVRTAASCCFTPGVPCVSRSAFKLRARLARWSARFQAAISPRPVAPASRNPCHARGVDAARLDRASGHGGLDACAPRDWRDALGLGLFRSINVLPAARTSLDPPAASVIANDSESHSQLRGHGLPSVPAPGMRRDKAWLDLSATANARPDRCVDCRHTLAADRVCPSPDTRFFRHDPRPQIYTRADRGARQPES